MCVTSQVTEEIKNIRHLVIQSTVAFRCYWFITKIVIDVVDIKPKTEHMNEPENDFRFCASEYDSTVCLLHVAASSDDR